ncbi:MAG: methyltransferase [Gammaproteobacteria bacterium]|nr:methyltransferase [Gammaproteobacteria bacterium]MDP2139400.1 methyltransferase [Gammaproteobacteria bacterium]MDP2346236.1 methyltransferase [Gammaproteobacteria bacterium]
MKTILIAAMSLAICSNLWAAEDFGPTRTKIEQAMQGASRTDAEKARDAVERKPVETLEFFGLRENMRVLELVPGGGWYTKILAPTLRENGKLYISIGTDGIADSVLSQPGFDRVEILPLPEGMALANIGEFNFSVTDLDMVVTFRNLHNMNAESRTNLNAAVFDSLKSGGLYGVKDHTRRHMEETTRANGRRMDPVLVIKEIQDAGFEFVDFSTLHASPVDALELEVGNADVTGRTDRFTLLFRKP